MGFDIVVVGSINQDLTVRVPHHPAPGETVLGTSHVFGAGGKGANQAVAAARLGRRVAMIGRVGDDQPGRDLVRGLEAEDVDVSHVGVDGDAPTGLALITLDEQAENAIAVSPGANSRLHPETVEEARQVIVEATVLLVQLEVPIESVQEAASLATGTVILNPAPAAALPDELSALADVIVPNRSELATLAGVDLPTDIGEVSAAAHRLSGHSDVIVTLGSGRCGRVLRWSGNTHRGAKDRLGGYDRSRGRFLWSAGRCIEQRDDLGGFSPVGRRRRGFGYHSTWRPNGNADRRRRGSPDWRLIPSRTSLA